MTIKGIFPNKKQILANLAFFFNEENSDISIEPFIDGDVLITVVFGNGKGWDSIESHLAEATKLSYAWGRHTLGMD
jgi:hypothetical protein